MTFHIPWQSLCNSGLVQLLWAELNYNKPSCLVSLQQKWINLTVENGVSSSSSYQTVLLCFILSQQTSRCLVTVLDLPPPHLVLVTWTLLWTVYSWYGLWFFSVIVCTRTVLYFFAYFSSSQRCKEHLLITNQQDADRLSCEQPMNRSFIFDYMTLHHLLEVQPLARNLEPFACRMRRGIKKQNIKYIRKKWSLNLMMTCKIRLATSSLLSPFKNSFLQHTVLRRWHLGCVSNRFNWPGRWIWQQSTRAGWPEPRGRVPSCFSGEFTVVAAAWTGGHAIPLAPQNTVSNCPNPSVGCLTFSLMAVSPDLADKKTFLFIFSEKKAIFPSCRSELTLLEIEDRLFVVTSQTCTHFCVLFPPQKIKLRDERCAVM